VSDPDCKFEPGVMRPRIHPGRCEAKGPCVPICPYGVLALRVVPPEERRGMSLRSRIKLSVHGGRQAYVANADACHGCGLCVQACPEHAIRLERVPSRAE
jgi:NAD-dependent dihydropyrimidine dehydrogenase PreA subunit